MESNTKQSVVVAEPRSAVRARLLQILDQLQLPYSCVQAPSQVLEAVRLNSPTALVVAPELGNLSGTSLIALARAVSPKLEGLVVDQPERDRGLIENLARRLRAQGSRT